MFCSLQTYFGTSIYFEFFFSPRFELPAADATQRDPKKLLIVCHFCGDPGHKALFCHKMPQEMRENEARLQEQRVS